MPLRRFPPPPQPKPQPQPHPRPRLREAPTAPIPRIAPVSQEEPEEARPRQKPASGGYRQDILASVVVFLVALPLCVGIAIGSGVKPESAIITGIVGALVTGMLPGSTLQVSGPAAGLAVLVFDTVQEHGMATLGMIVLLSGVLQIVMGIVRLGTWFQAIASSVVAGMLSGIGLLILASQLYVLADQKGPGNAVQNLLGLPGLLVTVSNNPAARGAAVLGFGLMVALVKLAWRMSHLTATEKPGRSHTTLRLTGGATFLTIPRLHKALDTLPEGNVHIDMTQLVHLDRTSRGTVENLAKQRRKEGATVTVTLPPDADEHFEDVGSH